MESPLEQVIDVAKAGATAVQHEFNHPDDDWQPIMIAVAPNEKAIVASLDFKDQQAKENIATKVIPSFIRKRGIVAVAITVSAWVTKLAKGDTLKVPVRKSPDKKEILEIAGMSADRSVILMADIERHPDKPPTLGPWEELVRKGDQLSGLFVDDTVEALKEVANELGNS
ncbi:MAG: hypothetical protein EBZ48_02800 [Proteobacteria bacterium]|nr:hypothetical protein [Pseudomonadota bacterium]